MPYRVARCSEFPNDNPSLHEGAIWVCAELGAKAACELPAVPEALEAVDEPEGDAGTIEVVDDLPFDDAVDEHPADLDEEAPTDETVAAESPQATITEASDPFEAFARVLEEVACASGADARAVACLRALLGQTRLDGVLPEQGAIEALVADGLVLHTDRGLVRTPGLTAVVLAWQGVVRGESEDLGPCGAATLDEWSANLVARVLGIASRSEGIRRELRRRGVAAFGFLADAA